MIENTPMFKIPAGDSRPRWVRIGILSATISNQMNGFSIIVTGTSNFGSNVPGMDIIQVSTRGGLNFQVYTLVPADRFTTTYGYRTVGSNVEIWIKDEQYSYEKTCVVTLAVDQSLNSGMQVGVLDTQYSQPTGFTRVIQINRFVSFNLDWLNKQYIEPISPFYGLINVAENDCFRIRCVSSVGEGPRVVYREFSITGFGEEKAKGKTIRILHRTSRDEDPPAVAAILRVKDKNNVVIDTYELKDKSFVDCYIDDLNKFYFMR
jgi:hypothetical protein